MRFWPGFDLLHFGEMHYYGASNRKETSTFADFVGLILPNLCNPELTNKNSYGLLRTKLLHSEMAPDGQTLLDQKQLENFDKTGVNNPTNPIGSRAGAAETVKVVQSP